jgi:hypothetical protein
MEVKNRNKPLWLSILRWSARILALLVAIFLLFMFIGESIGGRPANAQPLQARDYFLLSLFGLYFIGLIIGLWREGLGGLISLVFMAIHIIFLTSEGIKNLTYFYVMFLPSVLYILSWYFHRRWSRQALTSMSQ